MRAAWLVVLSLMLTTAPAWQGRSQQVSGAQLKAAIDIANAASSMGQPERGLKPLRDLCANLPEGFDAPQLVEAKRLLSP